MNHRPSMGLAVLSVVVAVGYVTGMGWTMYGTQADWPFWTWVLLGVGAPLLWFVMVDERARAHWVVGLLVGLGVGLAIFGWIGDGALLHDAPYGGAEAYYGITYEWTTNTLRFGTTIPGGDYPARVHPNRLLLIGATLLTSLGISLGLTAHTTDANPAPPDSTGAA